MATKKKKAPTKKKNRPVKKKPASKVQASKVPASPKENPEPAPKLPEVDPRIAAREKRAERKKERLVLEAEAKAAPTNAPKPNGVSKSNSAAVVTAGSTPESASNNRAMLETALAKLQPVESSYVALQEAVAFKLEALEGRVLAARKAVSAPLVKQVQISMDAEVQAIAAKWKAALTAFVDKALAKDEVYLAANKVHIEAMNAVITEVTPTLKQGFAITSIEPEKQRLAIGHAPNQVGVLLDVPAG